MRRGITAVVLAVVACGGETDAPITSRQVGDTTFVVSEEPLLGTGTLREVLRIGAVDGPPELLFGNITMFAVGPAGEVYVAQNDGDLRRFDSDGNFVQRVARVGEGPGEVEEVVGMDVAADGRLAIVDSGNQRVSIYSPEGEFIRQVRRPPGRPGYGRDAIQWDDEGQLWIAVHPLRSGPDTLRGGPLPLYARVVADGAVADTVYLPIRAWDGCERRQRANAIGFNEDTRLPFLPFAQWARDGNGSLAFGCSARYSIDIVGADGSVHRLSRPWDPPVMSDEERDYHEILQRINTGFERPRFAVPRERPAFLRIWLAEDGRIWTWPGAAGSPREASEEERASLDRFLVGANAPPTFWTYSSPTDGLDVFDSDGRWLGRVETPESWDANPFPGFKDPQFRGDTIWATTEDELGVSYLSKFVIEWSGQG